MSIRHLLSNAIGLGGITYRYFSATQGDDYFVHLGHDNITNEIHGKFGIALYQGESQGKPFVAAFSGRQGDGSARATLCEILPDGTFKYDSSGNEIPANSPDAVIMKSNSTGSYVVLHRAIPEKE